MKRVVALLASALVAAAFAATACAADYGNAPGTDQSGSTMKNVTGSKKAKKKAKKAKKAKSSKKAGGTSGMGTGGGTGPNYGTPNMGGPSGNELGQPQPQENVR